MSSIKKTLSHLPDNKPGLALRILPKLLESAKHGTTEPARTDDQNVKAWHYLLADLDIDGLPHTTIIKVREDGNGVFYYDQHVTERKTKDSPYKLGASETSSAVAPAGESKGSIDREVDPVKEKHSRFSLAAASVHR